MDFFLQASIMDADDILSYRNETNRVKTGALSDCVFCCLLQSEKATLQLPKV